MHVYIYICLCHPMPRIRHPKEGPAKRRDQKWPLGMLDRRVPAPFQGFRFEMLEHGKPPNISHMKRTDWKSRWGECWIFDSSSCRIPSTEQTRIVCFGTVPSKKTRERCAGCRKHMFVSYTVASFS